MALLVLFIYGYPLVKVFDLIDLVNNNLIAENLFVIRAEQPRVDFILH